MAKKTVLEIVQDVLSDMNSDEVVSITDTFESMQVAQIVQSTYEEMMANKNWPHLKELFQLEESGTTDRPTHMKLPLLVKELTEVNYNKKKVGETKDRWDRATYLTPEQFISYTNKRNTDASYIDSISDSTGVKINIRNDKAPTYYTTFDDEWLVFDSYISALDSTLVASKTQCIGFVSPEFTLTDGFTPDLPEEAFPALVAEVKKIAFIRVKQMEDPTSAIQSVRQRNWLSRKAFKMGGGIRFPNYGRRSSK